MKRFRSIAVAGLAVLVAAIYILPVVPAAAETDQAASSALSIAPKKQYEIEAGKSVDDKLTIRNVDNSSALQLSLRVIDFTYDDEQDSGVAKLFLDPNAEKTPWSLRSYIELPKTVTIGPGETKTVDMKVSIPQNQGAGSLYSAIIYSSASGAADTSGTASGASGNVGLSASGITLVFANVPGKVKEDLQIEKLGPYDKFARKYMPYFTTAMPQSIGYSLKNSGNWAEAPVGSLTVTGWFGRKYEINDVNPTKSLVLIGQTRTFSSCLKFDEKEVANQRSNTPPTTCVDPGLWPGYYRVTANLFYGANGNVTQEATKSAGFWYLPWWFIALCLVLAGVLFYYGRKAYIKVRTALYGPQRGKKKSTRRS